jgi:ubiquinone/menaquinone biosynthesis C-methylase UbiE
VAGRFDRVAFRSDRLPIDHFDARFSEENVSFWVPRLVRAAQITPGLDVLDVGCRTGGFARAIACSVPARVTGCDRSERFIEFAKRLPRPPPGTLGWVVGDAERLPFDASAFDRVLLSLVLHQLTDPGAAVAEAFRVLPGGGPSARADDCASPGWRRRTPRGCPGSTPCAPTPLGVTGSTRDRPT